MKHGVITTSTGDRTYVGEGLYRAGWGFRGVRTRYGFAYIGVWDGVQHYGFVQPTHNAALASWYADFPFNDPSYSVRVHAVVPDKVCLSKGLVTYHRVIGVGWQTWSPV